MTWPLWRHPASTLPADLVDTLLNAWIIGWDADRLRHLLRGVWNAPIFYPHRNALALSENLLGIAPLVSPVYWLTGNPVLTYNVAFTVSFAIAGTAMYLLAAALTGSRACGLVGGAFYAFCSFRFTQISHIQMIATGWLPVALFAVHRFAATRARVWLGLLAAACALQALSNLYMAYFMAVPLAIVAADEIVRASHERTRLVIGFASAGLVTMAILAPAGVRYYEARSDYRLVRQSIEVEMGSARVKSYLTGDPSIGLGRWLRAGQPIDPEKELFPGVTVLLLAAAAVWHAVSTRDRMARWVVVYGAVAIAAMVLSLGRGPYTWLLRVVPGMDGMRVPARFGMVAHVGLSVLAAIGACALLRRTSGFLRSSLVPICLAAIVADGWAVPLPVHAYRAGGRVEDQEVAAWLRGRPSGAVLHLPVVNTNFQTAHYQYASLFHPQPIVNGFSGYDAPLQRFFSQSRGPLYDVDRPRDVVRMLRSIGVRYVVIHPGDYNVTQQANDEHRRALALVRGSGQIVAEQKCVDAYAFELEGPLPIVTSAPAALLDPAQIAVSVSEGGERAPALTDGDRDTRWIGGQHGESSIAMALSSPTDVARVELQLARRSLQDYPREIEITGTDASGNTTTLYRGCPYAEFVAGYLRDPEYPSTMIELPPNSTRTLVVRETAQAGDVWWSVHELRLWRRTNPQSTR